MQALDYMQQVEQSLSVTNAISLEVIMLLSNLHKLYKGVMR